MIKKIASVVVTYNRKEQLLQNLKSQFMQNYPLETIIVIDNCSTDGTYQYLVENNVFNDKRVKYIALTENLGGAGGFERGTVEAFKSGADFALLMDDDGYALNDDTVSNLVKKTQVDNQLVMINSLVLCNDERLSFGLGPNLNTKAACEKNQKNGLIEGSINPFNGTLISKELYEKIGAPNGQFFIRGDEQEYQLRATEANAFIATVTDSLYYHPSFTPREVKNFLGKTFINSYDLPWKEYYGTRNMTYALRQRSKFRAFKRYLVLLLGLKLFEVKNKRKVRQFIKLGYKHGKKGILGKTILPGQDKL